jgi:hypothetical protein
MVQSKTAVAIALELWAESRERAITEVSKKASALASHGRHDEAEHFRYVARLLTVRAMHERPKAAGIRAADESFVDLPSPAHTVA